jgi:hypothetical protein
VALVVVGIWGLAAMPLGAQEPDQPAPPAATATDAETAGSSTPLPLARYVPRDHLFFYVEFAGLDAHADAWKKTAAYKMLNTTPLGEMLEDVAGQLLEKPLGNVPGRKVSGAELVAFCKSAARNGWVLAVSGGQKGGNPFVGTLVLRGAASKENKPLTSRVLGTIMGAEAKPRVERKAGRVLVAVPRGAGPEGGWVWWPEKNDLAIGFMQPSDADAILAVIDGKAPSAAEHAVLAQLAKPEGTFQPLMTALIDPAAVPSEPKSKMNEFFDQLQKSTGMTRLDYRWGFDDDALQSVTRLIAPSPRKSLLAIFDQPKLAQKQLIPIPEGVDSFAMLSASPAKVIEAITQAGPPGAVRAKLDETYDKIRAQSRLDVEKELLGNLGPKMAFYLAPGRSAAAADEPPPLPAAGADPMAVFSSLQGVLPKPTLIAELRDPAAFAKALDALMIAVNKELKAQAIEKAAQEPPATQPGAAGPGANRGRAEGAAERPARKRSSRETAAPEFRLMPGSIKTYMLFVPSDSPLKPTPPGVRPTIRLEGKYVAFSSTSESARAGLDAARKKDWKPSAEVQRALEHTPLDPIFLAVEDPRATVPAVLASLPGTLQTMINTTIAMSAAGAGAAPGGGAGPGGLTLPGAGLPQANGPGASPATSAGPAGRRGLAEGGPSGAGAGQPGYPGASGAGAGQPGYPGAPGSGAMAGYPGMAGRGGFPGGPGAPGGNAAAQESMIQIKVDPAKLPKAEELKALMSLGTYAVSVDDQSVRFVNRESFPNVVNGAGVGAVALALFLPAIKSAREKAMQELAARAAAAGGQPGPPGQPAAGGPAAAGQPAAGGPPGAATKGSRPGGRGGGARSLDPD